MDLVHKSEMGTLPFLFLLSTAPLLPDEPTHFLLLPLKYLVELSTLFLNKHIFAPCGLLEIGSALTGSDLLVGGGERGVKSTLDLLFHRLTS